MSPCIGHRQTLTASFYLSFNNPIIISLFVLDLLATPLESHVISFCNLIGGALAEQPEVNGLNPPMLPGSFLPCTEEEMSLGMRISLI